MALDVTVAGANADSYVSVADADAYLEHRFSDAWDGSDTTAKEKVLRAAARRIDLLPFRYPRSDSAQALRLPSSDMADEDGAYFIPNEIKEAQALLALVILEDPDYDTGGGPVSSVSIGSGGGVSVSYSDSAEDTHRLPPHVFDRLRRWVWKSGPGPAREWDSARRGYV